MPKKKSEIRSLSKRKDLVDKAGTRASRNKLKRIEKRDFTGLGMAAERALKFSAVEGKVKQAGKEARQKVKANLAKLKKIKKQKSKK